MCTSLWYDRSRPNQKPSLRSPPSVVEYIDCPQLLSRICNCRFVTVGNVRTSGEPREIWKERNPWLKNLEQKIRNIEPSNQTGKCQNRQSINAIEQKVHDSFHDENCYVLVATMEYTLHWEKVCNWHNKIEQRNKSDTLTERGLCVCGREKLGKRSKLSLHAIL